MRRLLLILAMLGLCGCNVQGPLSDQSGGLGIDSVAPPIAGAAVAGGTATTSFSLTAERGHIVVVDFWGSWCGPCRQEQPDINAVASRFMPAGVIFVGVAMRDDVNAVEAFQRNYNVAYGTVVDTDESIAGAYRVLAPPSLTVIDQHGNVVHLLIGTTAGLSAELTSLGAVPRG